VGEIDSKFIETLQEKISSSRELGTRILPVYIFSLLGKHPDLLIDGKSLVKRYLKHNFTSYFGNHKNKQKNSSKNAVLVLQTNSSEVELPYFVGNKRVGLDARQITVPIVAGLAGALGGIVSPSVRLPSLHAAPQEDFTWALGSHLCLLFLFSHPLSLLFPFLDFIRLARFLILAGFLNPSLHFPSGTTFFRGFTWPLNS